MYVHKYESRRKTWGVIFQIPSIMIFDIVSRIGLELTKKTRLAQDLPVSASPALGLQTHASVAGFCCRLWGSTPGPHACLVSTFLTEPSPQVPVIPLYKMFSPLLPVVILGTVAHQSYLLFWIRTKDPLTCIPSLPVHNSLLTLVITILFSASTKLTFWDLVYEWGLTEFVIACLL